MKEKMSDLHKDINEVYEWGHGEGIDTVMNFNQGQKAQLILTNTDWQKAKLKIDKIADRIREMRIVEIGAGVGYAAIEMAKHATFVTAIESDPAWNWIFCKHLYKIKPDNLIWVFGDARKFEIPYDYDFGGDPRKPYDVCIIFTRSGVEQMKKIGEEFANEVIMYHQEYDET